MFERFTAAARQTVIDAQAEARSLRHSRVGTEHLLLALLRQGDGIAGRVLADAAVTREGVLAHLELVGCAVSTEDALATLGIDFDEVVRRVDEAFGPGALERTRAGRHLGGGYVPFSPGQEGARAVAA